jgi:hypothetical protein
MTFSVIRSDDPQWQTAPFIILRGDEVFLDGIQEESEAQSIADLLNTPLKIIPIKPQPRWLAGGRGGRHLATLNERPSKP